MTRILVIRAAIFALPFLAWLVWRQIARRLGRPPGATPWAALVAGGAMLAALSLIVTALWPPGPDTGRYVPGEVRANGSVAPGHFAPVDQANPPPRAP